MSLFCFTFYRDSNMSCSPNVKQTKQIKNNQTKHPGVITLDHQSLRSGVIFGSGSGVRAREGEVIRRI